jgi:methyl-accepting chemotaxis protein
MSMTLNQAIEAVSGAIRDVSEALRLQRASSTSALDNAKRKLMSVIAGGYVLQEVEQGIGEIDSAMVEIQFVVEKLNGLVTNLKDLTND